MSDPAPDLPTFDVLPLGADVRRAVDDLGYVNPTPSQVAVYEPACRRKDLVVQARTGTGKTAAFGLPLIDSIVKRSIPGIQAMVLCPTRELALQVSRELEALAKHRGTSIVAVYGGAPMGRQITAIEGGAQILVGTPGRVLDHLRRRTLDPKGVTALVLDESDEMLSMGFLPQINDIMERLPPERQVLLFSATVPREVVRIAEGRLKEPQFITLSGDHIGALEIAHYAYPSRDDKISELAQVLEVENPESAIIFCNTRERTKRVATALADRGWDADWLNADLSQAEREHVMRRTREGKLRLLVATDVAARGIDISHLTHVINHDFPESAEQYVHRTGRTGRAGKLGTAISQVSPLDVGNLYLLRLTYKIHLIEKSLPSARELRTRAEADVVDLLVAGYGNQAYHPSDVALARRLLSHEQAESVVAGLVRAHLGKVEDAPAEARALRLAPRPAVDEAAPVAARTDPPRGATPPRTESRPTDAPRGGDARRDESRGARKRAAPAPAAPVDGDAAAPQAEPSAERGSGSVDGNVNPVPTSHDAPLAGDGRPRRRRRRRGGDRDDREAGDDAEARLGDPPTVAAEDATEFVAEGVDGMDLAEVFVNIGRRDGASPTDFQTVLSERGGIGLEETGFVRVRHRHAFVGVRKDALERAISALNGASIRGRTASAEAARRS